MKQQLNHLSRRLKTPFVDVQWLAAKSLGKLGDLRAVEPLINALKSRINGSVPVQHGDWENSVIHVLSIRFSASEGYKKMVRKTAAWALGNIADERAVAGLTEALSDEDGEVRDTAQKALDSIKNEMIKKRPDASANVKRGVSGF